MSTPTKRDEDADELLTVNQIARLLVVEEETVRRWIRNGAMRARRVGPSKLIRVTRAELARHMTDDDR